MQRSVIRIGLTGGIATGKSSICQELQHLGAKIIDADKLGHLAYQPGSAAFDAIVNTFGEDIIDPTTNQINRRQLGGIVFGDPGKMKQLTDIVWPEVARLAQIEFEKLEAAHHAETNGKLIIVLEAAVLVEAGWQSLVDELWVTVVPPSVALDRLMKRNNLTVEEATKRMKSQISNEERTKAANLVIDNSTDLAAALEVVRAEFKKRSGN